VGMRIFFCGVSSVSLDDPAVRICSTICRKISGTLTESCLQSVQQRPYTKTATEVKVWWSNSWVWH